MHPGYCADPFAYASDGWCYVVGTGGETAGPQAHPAAMPAFPLLRSRDLGTWEVLGHALADPPWAEGPEAWAPAVAVQDGQWFLYYSLGDARIPRHQLHVAAADHPAGPYREVGPLPTASPFAIDPHPFRDADGHWWLFYARDFLDTADGAHPGTGLVCDRLVSMTRLAGQERTVLRAHHPWTLFEAQRRLYGRVWDWHTLEGPCVLRHADACYCLYSGSCFGTERYGVDYAVAPGAAGPWRDTGASGGPRILRSQGEVRGPGHCSVLQLPGMADLLVYHSWDATLTTRQLCLDVLAWTQDGPRCQPTRSPQELRPTP